MPWCYHALLLLCLSANVTWCYHALVLLCLGAIITWCFYALVLLCLGAILTWSYHALLLLCLGATMPWCCYALLLLAGRHSQGIHSRCTRQARSTSQPLSLLLSASARWVIRLENAVEM
jgi:hypothetical protein